MSASAGKPKANSENEKDPCKLRILFVDDEDMVLRMLRMAIASMQGQWDASYAARHDGGGVAQ
jgi:hypothetical protein